MKIGVIGPQDSVLMVINEVEKTNIAVECTPLIYSHYQETQEIVERNQEEFDGLLFTGTTPFRYAVRTVRARVLWEYIPRNFQSLFCAMLRTVYSKEHNLNRISVDSYHNHLVKEALAEIGIDDNDITILEAPYDLDDPNYEMKILEFHIDSYRSGGCICLTGLSNIEHSLKQQGIPVSRLYPTADIIIQQVQKLVLAYHIAAEREAGVAVISIGLEFLQEHSLYGKSDLETFILSNKAGEVIYSFAQRIEAALETHENHQYHIYIERKSITNELLTSGGIHVLKDLSALKGIKKVSVGIGYGNNIRQSKYHAELAHSRAMKSEGSCLFLMDEKNQMTGPLIGTPGNERIVPIDRDLMKISKECGVAMEKLNLLIEIHRKHHLDTTTPVELSRLTGLSANAINRILVKLESAGYLAVVGKESVTGTGRPSRVIRLLLPISR